MPACPTFILFESPFGVRRKSSHNLRTRLFVPQSWQQGAITTSFKPVQSITDHKPTNLWKPASWEWRPCKAPASQCQVTYNGATWGCCWWGQPGVSSEHVPIPQLHASPKPSSERSAVWLCLAGLSLQREDLISVLQILRAGLSILGQVQSHPAGRDVPMVLALSPSWVWTDPPTLFIWERENVSWI